MQREARVGRAERPGDRWPGGGSKTQRRSLPAFGTGGRLASDGRAAELSERLIGVGGVMGRELELACRLRLEHSTPREQAHHPATDRRKGLRYVDGGELG